MRTFDDIGERLAESSRHSKVDTIRGASRGSVLPRLLLVGSPGVRGQYNRTVDGELADVPHRLGSYIASSVLWTLRMHVC